MAVKRVYGDLQNHATVVLGVITLANVKRFLPRDAMHRPKRGLCRHAVSVCPSVRVSVAFVNYVKTNKHIKFFSPSYNHAILA